MNSENKQESVLNDTTINTTKLSVPNVCCGIYGLQNKLKPEKWYVGQSLNIPKRWSKYDGLKCKSQRKLYNALRKYGIDAFTKVILENCERNKSILNDRETFWVQKLDAVNLGYNLRSGGDGGGIPSEESRAKMRSARLGKTSPRKGVKLSADTIEKMRKSMIGRRNGPPSEETREKLRKSRTGILHSSDTKKKMSIDKIGRVWVTNGTTSKCIKSSSAIPMGFYPGRTCKKVIYSDTERKRRSDSAKQQWKVRGFGR